jgi:uncharacterized sulfatase
MKAMSTLSRLFTAFLSAQLLVVCACAGAQKAILDTDANNELDDQHAIAYLLLNEEAFDVAGITVNRTSGGGGIENHYAEAERVVTLCGKSPEIPVFRGADGDFETIRKTLNQPRFDGADAVNFIIEQARAAKEHPLLLIPVGKLTNIALALEKAPDIAEKVRIIWLGSNYPDPGEYNQVNDEPALNYILNTDVPFEIALVRYGKPSGTDAVRATLSDIKARMPGKGPRVTQAVIGRHGGEFHCFGDYSVDLFEHIELHGNPPSRALFDMAAVAIVKNPDWAKPTTIPAPILVEGKWVDRPDHQRTITLWEDFDKTAIIRDFFQTIESHTHSAARSRPNIFFFFADDWGRYASVYDNFPPNSAFKTPHFDRFAQDGIRFNNAFVTAPSCTPCRSSLLSGQYFYRTGRGAILQGAQWDSSIPSYPILLENAGYHTGYTYKVWSPGSPVDAPYGGKAKEYAKAGRRFCSFSQSVTRLVQNGTPLEQAKAEIYAEVMQNFEDFLADRTPGQPFCYWFGPTNTHRTWIQGSGKALWGLDPDQLKGRMPAFLPDVHEIREDMCDYLGEALALDQMLQLFLDRLEEMGERDHTLFVVSGDHGIPGFPRGKCNLYDLGTSVSLFVQWPEKAPGGRIVEDFINLMDLAPTFLAAAGEPIPDCMTGKSFLPQILSDQSGWIDTSRDHVITGRERHVAKARTGSLPYPQRAIRTQDFLYIRNFAPDRWPMGVPSGTDNTPFPPPYEKLQNNTFSAFADMDASPTKAWMVTHRDEPEWEMHWRLGFEKRPAEELYDLRKDTDQILNRAEDPEYQQIKEELAGRLMQTLVSTGDPRVIGNGSTFDNPPYAP